MIVPHGVPVVLVVAIPRGTLVVLVVPTPRGDPAALVAPTLHGGLVALVVLPPPRAHPVVLVEPLPRGDLAALVEPLPHGDPVVLVAPPPRLMLPPVGVYSTRMRGMLAVVRAGQTSPAPGAPPMVGVPVGWEAMGLHDLLRDPCDVKWDHSPVHPLPGRVGWRTPVVVVLSLAPAEGVSPRPGDAMHRLRDRDAQGTGRPAWKTGCRPQRLRACEEVGTVGFRG